MLAEIIKEVAGQFQEPEHNYYPRPSLAGSERCTRQMVYWGLGIKKEQLPGRSLLVFDDSSWHEDLTADWIRKTVYQLHSEQMHINIDAGLSFLKERICHTKINGRECGIIIPRGHLSGHIDGIVTDITGTDYLWEHKAINHFTWQKYHDGTIPYDYVSQCCMYLRGLHEVNPNINRAILLMKNKNTAAYLEFIIYYDYDNDIAVIEKMTDSNNKSKEILEIIPDICKSCFDKFQAVNEYISKQILPKRDYFIGDDWHCEYCGWAATCWEGYKKEFTELKTDTMLPDDVADMLRYYKELGGQKSDIEKEYKELSSKIKETMKQIGAREGRAGEFIARLTLTETSRIDKELLTEAEIEKATVKSISERLYVSTPKEIKGVVNG